MNTGCIELRFPADARYLVLARLSLSGVAQTAGLDPETLADLKLAITEACSNAVRHAYGSDGGGDITLRIDLQTDRLSVEVVDHGGGFDPTTVDEWQAAALQEHGMGLSIIRSVTDNLEVESGADGIGTSVRFTKQLDHALR